MGVREGNRLEEDRGLDRLCFSFAPSRPVRRPAVSTGDQAQLQFHYRRKVLILFCPESVRVSEGLVPIPRVEPTPGERGRKSPRSGSSAAVKATPLCSTNSSGSSCGATGSDRGVIGVTQTVTSGY